MSLLDIVLILPLVYGIIRGIIKGFVLQLASFLGLIAGIYFAKHYAHSVSELLYNWFDIPFQYGKPLAFLITFLAIALLFYLMAKLIDKFFELISLKWLNKMLGALLGGLKYALVLSVLLNVFQSIDSKSTIVSQEHKNSSIFYNPLKSIVPRIMPYIDVEDFKKKE